MTTPLHTRAEVGLRPPTQVSHNITPGGITVHYAGPAVGVIPDAAHVRCASVWRAFQAFHMAAPREWSDIAYTSGVCPHGHRYEGRGPGVRTAANGTNDGNQLSYAVCYLAGEGEPLTELAKLAYGDEAVRLGRPLRWGHHDWKPTSCPGAPLYAWRDSGFPPPLVDPHTPVAPGRIVVPPALNAPAVALVPVGAGYLVVCADGGVWPFGDLGGLQPVSLVGLLNRPLVGGAPTPSGRGWWLVAADGGVFPFGDAAGLGSLGATPLNAPVVGLTPTPTGAGYWLVAADGGVFPFGDAAGLGSVPSALAAALRG